MISRRSFLSGLLTGLGLALAGKAAEAAPMAEAQTLPDSAAAELDRAPAAFSQSRPQLHYNRQRQHRPPERRRRWRTPRHRTRRSR